MKLYHNGEPEGWQIPGKQDRKAERIDVPSSPAELAAWLNDRNVTPAPAAAYAFAAMALEATGRGPLSDDELEEEKNKPVQRGPRVPGHCDECGRSAAGTLKLAQGEELDAIALWMDTADLWAIEQLADRAREVARGRGVTLEGRAGQ